ncbi:MAG: DNA mismatch repair endonuclease MutL [Puniceicoccales bacterium]|jgi:DNA mismatch repair protein MutL|nr:DNA mismatch repair endonuclease MutL [Puniceicoccales bacterium]
MAKIHLLPETIINQIAAGEVVDRPASIVKELIENSIDAQAKHITVKFHNGGDSFLSISDDGIGMDEEDAAMAFERNATSKLTTIKDLESLGTFGFRGEAIASIASVARMIMQTNDGNGGTEIHCDAGKKIHQKACGCPRGTFIEIRNLFEKIPARKQFLRSETTEAIYIVKAVRAFVLAEPDIYFELYKNGKLLFSSPDSRNLQDRTELLFGHFDQYTPLDYTNDTIHLHGLLFEHAVDGVVSKPDFLIFVNKRNVNNPTIVRLVRDTYAMIKSRVTNVGGLLFLEFQSNFVDFNVHPQKKEVRFKSEMLVKKFIENSVTDALKKKIATLCQTPTPETFTSTIYSEQLSQPLNWYHYKDASPDKRKYEETSDTPYVPSPHQVFDLSLPQNLGNFPNESLIGHGLWRFVGMFGEERFAIFERQSGLIFVNLAAAQKCILWDKFLNSPDQLIPQILLIPRTVTINPEQIAALDSLLEIFANFSIEVESFGKNVYKITALPREVSEEMVVQWIQDPSFATASKLWTRDVFAKQFCAGLPFQSVGQGEVKILIDQLLHCYQFMIAPDNTNVLFEIDRCDFAKKFGLQLTPKRYCLG